MSKAQNTPSRLKGFDDFSLSLGDELRGERATLGKSLLDVQRDLRIKAAYIAAIENCEPSVFPNKGFIAGYVRSYARYLKLDSDEMFARFCVESGFEGVNAGMTPSKAVKKEAGPALKGAEVSPRFANYGTASSESILNIISPSGLASATVLVLLIGGLSYGGWTLLNDIQRVQFAPVDQSPSAEIEIANLSADLTGDVGSVGLKIESDENLSSPDIDVIGRIYRPQELSVPKMQPRDGPIAAIDPDSVGVLRPEPEPVIIETVSESIQSLETALLAEPVVTVETQPTKVQIYATRAAWVRVHFEDGTVLFEKILEKGEYYDLPTDIQNPLLRAGNSGSVYVVLNNTPYGPVGNGTSVAKQVSLTELDVPAVFSIASDLELAPVEETTLSTAESQ